MNFNGKSNLSYSSYKKYPCLQVQYIYTHIYKFYIYVFLFSTTTTWRPASFYKYAIDKSCSIYIPLFIGQLYLFILWCYTTSVLLSIIDRDAWYAKTTLLIKDEDQ